MDMPKLIVGQIVNIFGIHDELKIVSFSDFSAKRYKIGNKLVLRNEMTDQEFEAKVTSYRRHRGLDIVGFEGITTQNAAQYFNWNVLADKHDVKLPKHTYFYEDLVGCLVEDDQGMKLGEVVKVTDYGAHPLLIVKRVDDTTFQVPFVPFFIKNVDITAKAIIINVIDGML